MPVARRMKHSKQTDTIKTPEFIWQVQQSIDDNPIRFIISNAKQDRASEGTIKNVVQEYIRYKFYKKSSF